MASKFTPAGVGPFLLAEGADPVPLFGPEDAFGVLDRRLREFVEGAGVEVENTGHFHLLIDLETLPDMDGPLPATPQILHFGQGQSEAKLDLAEGPHTLRVMLADHLHVPHDPPVISDPIRITVAANAPLVEDDVN